ncbi:MAG: choice-of-anchor I family protein [Planctomycetaceae bacterium]
MNNSVPGIPGVWAGPFAESPGALNVFPPAVFEIAATDAEQAEGNSGTTDFTFTVTRTVDTSGANDVDWSVTSMVADGADFVGGSLPGGTLTFAAGEFSKTITVSVNGDVDVEADESFVVTLSGATNGALIGIADADGLIQNDDATVEIGNAVVTEGDAGTNVLTFDITLSGDIAGGFTLDIDFPASNATPGTDFVAAPGTVTFVGTNGEVQQLMVTVNGDTDVESNETVFVELNTADSRVTFTDAIGIGTIVDDDTPAPVGTGEITLSQIGTATLAGAEISDFDPGTARAFVTTPIGLQIVNLSNPAVPTLIATIDPTSLTGSLATQPAPTSVAVHNGLVAIAVPDVTSQNPGRVLFLDTDGNLLGGVTVGALPDMLTFTPDGSKILVADEGEPGATDPAGMISIIDLSGGPASATASHVDFTVFDGTEVALRALGIRIFPGVAASADFEPEYIAVSDDGTTAFVTLQENNAVAVVDIASAALTDLQPLGVKDHSLPGNGLDASDRDGMINIQQWPVFGLRLPDGIASFSIGGQTYYITANEGDDRGENERIKNVTLDPTAFPNAAALQQDEALGRIDISTIDGDTDGDGDYDQLFTYGARSFSIFDAGGNLIFDSGDMIARVTASQTPSLFNANNGSPADFDTRSDNKGAEPEGVTVAQIGDQTYAFVGLERAGGGVMVFNVTNPAAPAFVQYLQVDGHISPEGLHVVQAADSPTGRPLLLVTNEVSNTLQVLEIDLPAVSISDATVAEGNSGTVDATFVVTLSAPSALTVAVDFATADGSAVAGEDYAAASGTLTFAPGETSKNIVVTVIGDTIVELNELFHVNLSSPSAAVAGRISGAGVIQNDDTSLSIVSDQGSLAEGNSGTTEFTFTVTRSGDPTGVLNFGPLQESAPISDLTDEDTGSFVVPAGWTAVKLTSLKDIESDGSQSTVRVSSLNDVGSMWDMSAFSPDGRYIFIPHETQYGAGVSRFDTTTGLTVRMFQGDGNGASGDFSNDFGALDPAIWNPWTGNLVVAEEWSGLGRLFEIEDPTKAVSGPTSSPRFTGRRFHRCLTKA